MRLVLSVLKQFHNRGENIDDLFQVGCVGLVKAVDNFDPGMGVQFSTYAVPMILGEIRRYLRDNNVIRVSRSLRRIAHKALQARGAAGQAYRPGAYHRRNCRFPGIASEEVVHALDANFDPIPSTNRSITTAPTRCTSWTKSATPGNDDTSWMQKLLLKGGPG